MTPQPLPSSAWEFAPHRWVDDDCVAIGADLEPSTVVAAYRAGAFPMPVGGVGRRRQPAPMAWWSPLERGVLEPEDLRVSRSLRRSCRRLQVSTDEAFAEVLHGCADPRRPGGWIDESITAAYTRLHELGWAHSIEVRDDTGSLVGGLYGLAIGGLFAGESMFHRVRDASKVALVGLAEMLSDDHVADRLVDVQWQTPYLATLGVVRWPRARYLDRLEEVLAVPLPAPWR